MARLQLTIGDVEIGQPLPFHVMDSEGRILLNCGYAIPDQAQLERLIERGVYFDVFEDDSNQHQVVDQVSVYRLVVAVADEYQSAMSLPADSETINRLQAIAQEIDKLCALDADAALGFILLHKDSRYSIRHAFASAIMTHVLMTELKQSAADVALAVTAALAMNLCMMELQDQLYQQEIALTLEQKQLIVLHSQRAAALLAGLGCQNRKLLDVIEDHHETINGTGYARRKKAPDLNTATQVVSLADRYCAVVSERAYRPATPPNVAARDLLSRQAASIDVMLSAHFIRVIGVYPPGTVVTLANGETAVVVKRTLHPTQPVVRSLRSRNGIRYPEPPKRLTSKESFAITDTASPEHLKGVDLASLWPPVESDGDDEGIAP